MIIAVVRDRKQRAQQAAQVGQIGEAIALYTAGMAVVKQQFVEASVHAAAEFRRLRTECQAEAARAASAAIVADAAARFGGDVAARRQWAQEENDRGAFVRTFCIDAVQESLFGFLSTAAIERCRATLGLRDWADDYLGKTGGPSRHHARPRMHRVLLTDVEAGIQVAVMQHWCAMRNAEVTLSAGGAYTLRYEPLRIAAVVALIGKGNVVFEGENSEDEGHVWRNTARLVVRTQGVSFAQGLDLANGSATMTKCTSTGEGIGIERGASLVMEDSRVFGSGGHGVSCLGDKLLRCMFEDNAHNGVSCSVGHSVAELVDCVICKDGLLGLTSQGKIVLRGGTISENGNGVSAGNGSKVTVAKAKEDMPQTVCKDNTGQDWRTYSGAEIGGEIIGIPQEKITV